MAYNDGEILAHINAVRERIASAAQAAGRPIGDVRLLLATKQQPAERISAAVQAWEKLRDAGDTAPLMLGENRVQELVAKESAYREMAAEGRIETHLIGHLQRNKLNRVLPIVDAIQSVDSLALAQAISSRHSPDAKPLAVLIQVNVSGEESKSGVSPDDAIALAQAVAALPNTTLRGFMTIGLPIAAESESATRTGYAALRRIRDEVIASGKPGTASAKELSMGMSHDLEQAIAEGATIVRVGEAVFGQRV
jgi:PLP dependent protein